MSRQKKEQARCSACGQSMIVYKRFIRMEQVFVLRQLYEKFGLEPAALVDVNPDHRKTADFFMLKYFGLIEHAGSKWAITAHGAFFLKGQATVDAHVYVFNDRVMPYPPDEGPRARWFEHQVPNGRRTRDHALKHSEAAAKFGNRQTELFQ